MSRIRSRRTGAAALVAAMAALIALMGVASSASAASIYACQKKKGGALRIVTSKTKCKKSEKKLKWSTTGAAGKNGTNGTNGTNGVNGTNGAAGAPGAIGPIGPSTAYNFNSGNDVLGFDPVANTDTIVATLNVPAGSYAVWSKVLVNNNAATAEIHCRLLAGATTLDGGDATNHYVNTDGTAAIDRMFYALAGTVTLAASGSLTTVCHTGSVSGNYLDRTITAIKVGALG